MQLSFLRREQSFHPFYSWTVFFLIDILWYKHKSLITPLHPPTHPYTTHSDWLIETSGVKTKHYVGWECSLEKGCFQWGLKSIPHPPMSFPLLKARLIDETEWGERCHIHTANNHQAQAISKALLFGLKILQWSTQDKLVHSDPGHLTEHENGTELKFSAQNPRGNEWHG